MGFYCTLKIFICNFNRFVFSIQPIESTEIGYSISSKESSHSRNIHLWRHFIKNILYVMYYLTQKYTVKLQVCFSSVLWSTNLNFIGNFFWIHFTFIFHNIKEEFGYARSSCNMFSTGWTGAGCCKPACKAFFMKNMATWCGCNISDIIIHKKIRTYTALCPHLISLWKCNR